MSEFVPGWYLAPFALNVMLCPFKVCPVYGQWSCLYMELSLSVIVHFIANSFLFFCPKMFLTVGQGVRNTVMPMDS